MDVTFKDASARVLIVEETGSGRQLLSDVLRNLGFLDITVVGSGRDALDTLEMDNFDWIVSTMLTRHEVNALHVLRVISQQPELRHVRVSLVYDENDEDALCAAFSLGLMSCHPRSYLRDELNVEFSKLLEIQKLTGWRSSLTAAEYLRKHLIKRNLFAALVTMEKNLLDVYPGAPTLLLRLGEAQLRANDIRSGKSTLAQASIIDEKAKEVAQALLQKFAGASEDVSPNGPIYNTLGIDNCVIIDPDTAVLSTVSALLESVGVPEVHTFDDGLAAWKWIESHPEPGLILQEWRIPGLTGPLLLQRIRQLGLANVPIIGMSSAIKQGEMHLLREMGVDNIIPKPFGQQLFFKNVIWTLQQNRCPTEQKSLERKIHKLLVAGQMAEAERLAQAYFSDARISTASKKYVEAEIAYFHGRYRKARDTAVEALKLSGDSLLLLNLIGKSLLKLGDFAAALKFFDKASSLSPMNVEHLCNLAVSHFELGSAEQADKVLENARTIDATNPGIAEIECQHAIIGGKDDKAKELMDQLQSIGRVVAYMNNRAVALTRSGRYDEGIKLYHQTDKSLPVDSGNTKDVVAYNLGLAYVRYGELEKAKEVLRPLVGHASGVLNKKASSLLLRIEKALEKGTTLSIFVREEADLSPEDANADVVAKDANSLESALGIQRGDICLHGLFNEGMSHPIAVKLLEGAPRFKSRTAIIREQVV